MSIKEDWKKILEVSRWVKALNRKGLHELTDEQYLFKTEESEYGGSYRHDLLEQYKMYVELTDRINERLQRFYYSFLTINGAIVGGIGYFQIHNNPELNGAFVLMLLAIISYLALFFCCAWAISIRTHRDLYERRLKIIESIEEKLPLSLLYAELKLLETGKDPRSQLHVAQARVEAYTIILFLIIYFISFLYHVALLLLIPLVAVFNIIILFL